MQDDIQLVCPKCHNDFIESDENTDIAGDTKCPNCGYKRDVSAFSVVSAIAKPGYQEKKIELGEFQSELVLDLIRDVLLRQLYNENYSNKLRQLANYLEEQGVKTE